MSFVIYKIAKKYLNLREWPGAQHNPLIVKFFKDSHNGWVQDDETPWCAAFVGAVCAESGMVGTGRLNARSYLEWGYAIKKEEAEKGDIVVLWRGAREGKQGHVGFFDAFDGKAGVRILGGNQDDKVSIKSYPVARILSIRRARRNVATSKTMRTGAVGIVGAVSTMMTSLASLDGVVQLVVLLFGFVAAIAVFLMMRERVKKWVFPL